MKRSHDGCPGILYIDYPNRGNPGVMMNCTDCDYNEAQYPESDSNG